MKRLNSFFPSTSLRSTKRKLPSASATVARGEVRQLKTELLAARRRAGLNKGKSIQIESELKTAKMYLDAFWNMEGFGIWVIDKQYRLMAFNEFHAAQVKKIFGKTLHIGDANFMSLDKANVQLFKEAYRDVFNGKMRRVETKIFTKGGKETWGMFFLSPVRNTSGNVIGAAIIARDSTDEKHLENELRKSNALYLTLAKHIPESNVFLLNKQLEVLVAEGNELQRAGIFPHNMVGKKFDDVISESVRSQFKPLLRFAFSGKSAKAETSWGNQFYSVQAVPVRDEKGGIFQVMGVVQNITEHKRAEEKISLTLRAKEAALKELAQANAAKTTLLEELQHQTEILEKQAKEDALTGLFNRRYLNSVLEQEFRRAKRYGNPLSVAMCDIDFFKQVNDKFSHHIGDEVLKVIAKLLKNYTRSVDTVGRYGGEEFVLILPETSKANAKILCEKIRRAIERHHWNSLRQGLRVTMSMGICDNTALGNYEKMLNEADNKLYKAKGSGRNAVYL
jgi:diguanylate cyclase (GGDEF)-like protein/PAS domain S-box-containing protein